MKKIFYTFSSIALVSLPLSVLADDVAPPDTTSFKLQNPFKGGSDLTAIVTAILQNVIMPIAAVVVVLAIIYSGFKYLTAQGKPEDIRKANEGLMYALIGAAILLGATG